MVSEHTLRLGMTEEKMPSRDCTQELFIINIITTIAVSIVFVITLFYRALKEQQTLLWINGPSLILNAVGVNWFSFRNGAVFLYYSTFYYI